MNLIGQNQKTINERACNSLMTIQVHISTEYGLKPLIAAVNKLLRSTQIHAEKARLARIVERLTPYQKPIDFVKGRQSLLRTYLYAHTMALSQAKEGQQSKGKRVAAVTSIEGIYNDLMLLKNDAQAASDGLAAIWDDMLPSIQREVRDLEIDISDILVSGAVLAGRFVTAVGTPQCIQSADISHMQLPVHLAEKFSKAGQDELTAMLEGAKTQSLLDGLSHMELIITQLSTGKRLSQSLVEHAKTHSSKMRGMVEAYDQDPRILAICDDLDLHIANKTTDIWNDDPVVRQKSLDVATSIRKNLTAITAPVTKTQIDYANIQLAGGLLPDLID